MKLTSLMAAVMAGALLAGCASDSANVYSKNEMRRAATARSGVVQNVREVKMEDSTGIGGVAGGVLGGVVASQNIGGGTGQIVSGVLGAIAGGLIGNQIEKSTTAKKALEITVKLDNGSRLVVVQEADIAFSVGQRVDVLDDGRTSRVVPYMGGNGAY
ncbi:glycine zipper 2TM domain-containing protein [Andreprevotia chitinilytica]|uniref:glycine zipper 2TM domain-containing protein n=1 Tax=Andreprevotia chitinilytica TaxID=396808 RepID=UPI000690ADA8|nr:glycine zipper 2TM domain-containing protein [Andreprevotia chitinilytica]